MKNTREGSLFISILIALVLLSVLMGIIVRNAVLFSSLALHKQAYTVQFYAADALLEYGIAYACNNYERTVSAATPTYLSLPVWPPSSTAPRVYAGKITVTKKQSALFVHATLLEQTFAVQTVSCTVTKKADNSYSVSNWTLDT